MMQVFDMLSKRAVSAMEDWRSGREPGAAAIAILALELNLVRVEERPEITNAQDNLLQFVDLHFRELADAALAAVAPWQWLLEAQTLVAPVDPTCIDERQALEQQLFLWLDEMELCLIALRDRGVEVPYELGYAVGQCRMFFDRHQILFLSAAPLARSFFEVFLPEFSTVEAFDQYSVDFLATTWKFTRLVEEASA